MNSVEEVLKATLVISFMWLGILVKRNILVGAVGRITGLVVRLKSVRGGIRVFTSGIAHFVATGVIRE